MATEPTESPLPNRANQGPDQPSPKESDTTVSKQEFADLSFQTYRTMDEFEQSDSVREKFISQIEALRDGELNGHGWAGGRQSLYHAGQVGLDAGSRASYDANTASPFKDHELTNSYLHGYAAGQSRVEIQTSIDHMRDAATLDDDDNRYVVKVLETDAARFGERNSQYSDEAIQYLARHRGSLENPFTDSRLQSTYNAAASQEAQRAQEAPKVPVAEAFAVTRALDAGNRDSVLQERAAALGTSTGSAGFSGAVTERVREKLAGIPALSYTLPPRSDPTIPAGRDPQLEREATAVLVAARAVGLERDSGRPHDDDAIRVAAIDKELNIRRAQGEAVDAIQSRLTGKDYEQGAQALNALSVQRSAGKPKATGSEVIRESDEREME